MTRLAIRLAVAGACVLLIAGCGRGPARTSPVADDEPPLGQVRFAVTWDFGIRVYTGKGRLLLRLDRVPDGTRKVPGLHVAYDSVVYTGADVRPAGDRLAAVRCRDTASYGVSVTSSSYEYFVPGPCELLTIDLSTREERVLLSPPDGNLMGRPVWSPDGEMIALLVGRDLLVLRAATGGTIRRVAALRGPAAGWTRWRDDTLCWDRAGGRLFVYTSARTDVAAVDAATGSIEWLGFVDILWLPTSHNDRYAVPQSEAIWSRNLHPGDTAKRDAMLCLAGSAEHPVWDLSWSPGRRYYFYVVYDEGFLGSTRVEGYDTVRERTFRIDTLERVLYRE